MCNDSDFGCFLDEGCFTAEGERFDFVCIQTSDYKRPCIGIGLLLFFFTCVQCHYLIIEGFLVPFKVSSINNAKLKYEASLKANFSDHTSVVHAFLSEFSTKERVLLSFALIQLQTLRLIEHCNYVSWGNIFEQALLLPLPFHSIKEIALITIVMQVKQPNVP